MKLSTALAQEIVQNIKDVLHKEINFMNEEGIIIASTDPARLQHRHGGQRDNQRDAQTRRRPTANHGWRRRDGE